MCVRSHSATRECVAYRNIKARNAPFLSLSLLQTMHRLTESRAGSLSLSLSLTSSLALFRFLSLSRGKAIFPFIRIEHTNSLNVDASTWNLHDINLRSSTSEKWIVLDLKID